jgi:hypothetical protein
MIRSLLLTCSLLPFIATAADDSRISFLEQEVRNLERQVQVLSRQLDELRNRPDRPALKPSAEVPVEPAAALPQWVDARKWRELRLGMSEIDVISSLGPPTSLRKETAANVLLYERSRSVAAVYPRRQRRPARGRRRGDPCAVVAMRRAAEDGNRASAGDYSDSA